MATYSASAIFVLLGVMHLAYTLHDCVFEPRFFRPVDRDLLARMMTGKTAMAPQGRSYWRGVLGFNISHSFGLLLLGLLVFVAVDQQLVWLQATVVVVSLAYTIVSHMCWFGVPTLFAGMTTILLSIAILS